MLTKALKQKASVWLLNTNLLPELNIEIIKFLISIFIADPFIAMFAEVERISLKINHQKLKIINRQLMNYNKTIFNKEYYKCQEYTMNIYLPSLGYNRYDLYYKLMHNHLGLICDRMTNGIVTVRMMMDEQGDLLYSSKKVRKLTKYENSPSIKKQQYIARYS